MMAVSVMTTVGIRRRRRRCWNRTMFGLKPDQWLGTGQDVDGDRVKHDGLKDWKCTLIFTSESRSRALYTQCCRLHIVIFLGATHDVTLKNGNFSEEMPSFYANNIKLLYCLATDHHCLWLNKSNFRKC